MDYVMFLRGINVGGIQVPMAELKACLEGLGLHKVKTYLQTGNVRFASSKPATELKPAIEQALGKQFHYQAFVLIYPASKLQTIIDDYPFQTTDQQLRYVIFCASQAVAGELVTAFEQLGSTDDQVVAGQQVVYWRVAKGSTLQSPFGKLIAKPKYKATTTNRNLNTLTKMV